METGWIDSLLKKHRNGSRGINPEKLTFFGVGDCDVYNPTTPFKYQGKTILCARVEKRESEQSEAVFFYEKEAGKFYPVKEIKRYQLQDPFIAKIGENYIFGGTEIFPHKEIKGALSWHTKFYYGTNLSELKEFMVGPEGMKDVRLVELKDHRIGIFTRSQGEKGGRGKIGFTIVTSLEDVTKEVMQEAPLLSLFSEEEWGGVNEPILLEDGTIGVLGHIARFSKGDVRHYYSMSFIFEPENLSYTNLKIIAERADFLKGDRKRPDLQDVLFSGGLTNFEKDTAVLYVGVSDCEVQKIKIKNPFIIEEKESFP